MSDEDEEVPADTTNREESDDDDMATTPKKQKRHDNSNDDKSLIANVVRRVSSDTYVVQFKGHHGFVTIQCYAQHVDRRLVDRLYNSDVFLWNHGQNPTVRVNLGNFCLKHGAFLNCLLTCPPSYSQDQQQQQQSCKISRKAWGQFSVSSDSSSGSGTNKENVPPPILDDPFQ